MNDSRAAYCLITCLTNGEMISQVTVTRISNLGVKLDSECNGASQILRVSSISILAWENSHDIVPSLAIRRNPNAVVDHMRQSTRHFYLPGIRISVCFTLRVPVFVAHEEHIERTQGFNQTFFSISRSNMMDRHRPFVKAMSSLYPFQCSWPWPARFTN